MFSRAPSLLAILLLAFPVLTIADPLPTRAPRIVDYDIDVRLDATKKTLAGKERLTWTNPSTDTVGELWFHLYLNAFRNNRSTFFRESGGRLRSDDMPEGGWGWIDVRRMVLADGTDLTRAIRFEHPDDGNVDDRTLVRVPLPQPVPPGGSIALTIDFEAQLPRVFARTGYHQDYFLVGQWFPKIAVYEPGGTRGRSTGVWNRHQFHANSEFYADYGRFTVRITAPSTFVVGATGVRTAATQNPDGTKTWTYAQEDVHDFAWTADPRFVEVTGRFSASADVTAAEYQRVAARLGRALDEVRLSDVEIRLLMQPGHLPQAGRHMEAAKLGLKYFGLWYGRYPYRTLTVVDPRPGAGGSGGMEYPTFITAGTSMLLNRWPFDRIREPEFVTIHEFGHQFWYGLVANNEFEEAWLDEGINSYSTGRIMDLAYGPDRSVVEFLGLQMGAEDIIRAQNTPARLFDRVRQPSWTYSPGMYSFYSYTKPELALRTLEHHLGYDVMGRVMRTYHERWRFRHPSSDDFYAVASEIAGRDLSWYFQQAIEGTEVLDYEIASLRTARVAPVQGYIERDGRSTPAPESDSDDSDKRPWRSTVTVRRLGDFVFPVDLLLRYEGRDAERVQWDGRGEWTTFTREGPHRLIGAEIDPDRRVTLEVNRINGSRRTDASALVATTWTARWTFWLQNLLAGVGL